MIKHTTPASRLLLLFCMLFTTSQTDLFAQEQWALVQNEEGVTIYSRKIADHAESEFKGISTINQPVEVVGAVLADIPAYTQLFYNCRYARKLQHKMSSDHNFLLYMVIETPWPLWDRDIIYFARTTIDIGSERILIQSKALGEPIVPIRKDHVRITDSELQWILERFDSIRTKVTFTKRTNAGGSLGGYLSDVGCRKTIFHSLINLHRIAADPKYAALGERLKEKYGKR